ncbi:hypothetical protein [uncultured Pontibacter sp.]|uniref:hypothetical protein n=1 Tax=uncultured Pontibacter sp. TaxID=453356 RepID=UPI00262812BD|nr:hypothetical protein [uncultured Pontibacter sp.]
MENRLHPTDYEEGRPPKRPYQENRLITLLKRPAVFIPLLLALAFLVILLFINSSKNTQLREAREQAAQEREVVVTQANQRVTENTTYFLRTLMMPFSWSVRTAMMSRNMEQVDQYLYAFVQEPDFELVLLADNSGKIISTTNQKYKGELFADHFESSLLQVESITLDTSDSSSIKVAAPIMGLNSKLGTLYTVYNPKNPIRVDGN